MHIPDGYLSPQTYVPAFAAMLALWTAASARLRQGLRLRQVPLLALGAAFSFVIMMFNVPLVGGSSGHAVGAVLAAILLGPWAAVMAVSLALIVQAVIFGDGGITALGANCLTMAVVMPFVGWWVYRLLAGAAPPGSRRHLIAGAIAGYVGLNAAALVTAVLFGIQPLIAHDAAGRPLYCPFGLQVAVPLMAGGHLLVFGWVEAIVTGLALAFLQRTAPGVLPAESPPSAWQRCGYALLALVVLSPLGLLVPLWLHGGTAWGEWAPEELPGPVPSGLERLFNLWHAPLPDYALPGFDAPGQQAVLYALSALLGIALLAGTALLLGRLLTRGATAAPRGRSAARRALGTLLRMMAVLVDDGPARARGLLQAIDPRVKLPALLACVVLATLLHGLPALLACYGLAAALALASSIPPGRLWGAWLAVPLVSALVVLPAALNVVTPGTALLQLGHGWSLTAPGLYVVARFTLRAAACVTPALLLVATTRPARLFHALRALGAPATFVMMLAMMERYLAVIARGAEEIHLAKLSRTLQPGSVRQEQAWVAAGIGALYRRTQALGHTVHLAMLARGYTGDPRLPVPPRTGGQDWAFLAGILVLGVGIWLLDWLGRG